MPAWRCATPLRIAGLDMHVIVGGIDAGETRPFRRRRRMRRYDAAARLLRASTVPSMSRERRASRDVSYQDRARTS